MKNILIMWITICFLFFVFIKSPDKVVNNSSYLSEMPNIPSQSANTSEIIQKLSKNKIQSLVCNVNIFLKTNEGKVNSHAVLYAHKPKSIRIIAENELDLGSNNDIFWFWSKRLDDGKLYFCKQENLSQSKLKLPLNPLSILENINLVDIDNDYTSIQYNNFYLLHKKINNKIKVKLVKDEKVIGNYLLGEKGQTLYSSEVLTFESNIPSKIEIKWFEENIYMILELKEIQTNVVINDKYWQKPNKKKEIEIGLFPENSSRDF